MTEREVVSKSNKAKEVGKMDHALFWKEKLANIREWEDEDAIASWDL